jgi:hypothetical protein
MVLMEQLALLVLRVQPVLLALPVLPVLSAHRDLLELTD